MKDDYTIPNFGNVPKEYDPKYFEKVLRDLSIMLREMRSEGQATFSNVRLTDLPTSSVGLKTGDLWNDSGTIKVA